MEHSFQGKPEQYLEMVVYLKMTVVVGKVFILEKYLLLKNPYFYSGASGTIPYTMSNQ